MNLLSRILAVGSMLLAVHAFAADAFEGKVALAITPEKGKPMTLNYAMKGSKLRMDTVAEGHQASMIMDAPKLEMTILMAEQNMYMVMPMKKPIEHEMEKHQGEAAVANTDVQVTGKTETILGYKTDQIVVTDKEKGTTTEMWVAQGLGTFMGLSGGGSPFGGPRKNSAAAAKWEEALKGKTGFPLRVTSHDAKGKETFKMEATKVEPGPQPDSLFVPPPGYQKFEMPNMGGMNPFKRE